jgi:hypothetical protein
VNHIVYCGSSILVETPESKAGISYLCTGFPNIEENLVLVTKAGLGVDPTSPDATAQEIEIGNYWIRVWKERYGGSPEKELKMQKCVNTLLERDDIVPRVGDLKKGLKIHVMQVGVPRRRIFFGGLVDKT